MQVRRRITKPFFLAFSVISVSFLTSAAPGQAPSTAAEIEMNVASSRTAAKWIRSRVERYEERIHQVKNEGAFILPFVVTYWEEHPMTGRPTKEVSEIEYTVVSKEALVNLITEQVILDPKVPATLTEKELKHLIALKVRFLQQATRRYLKKYEEKLAADEAQLAKVEAKLAALEKQLRALRPITQPATQPAPVRITERDRWVTVKYRVLGEKKTGKLTINFRLQEDGRVEVEFGGAKAVTLANGSSFGFQSKQRTGMYAKHYDVQITIGREPDGRLTARGQYKFHVPSSASAERRKVRTAVF